MAYCQDFTNIPDCIKSIYKIYNPNAKAPDFGIPNINC